MEKQAKCILMADSVIKLKLPYTEKWAYDYGVLLSGFQALYEKTHEHRFFDCVKHGMDYFVREDGNIRMYNADEYTLDNINNGKTILWLYEQTGEKKYKLACDRLLSQLRTQPRTSEGAFWHKKIYPWQIWLDGLFMASPFYAEYVAKFGQSSEFSDITKQFLVCECHLRDEKTGLLYHAWDEKHVQPWCSPKTGLSPHFWGRSMGWYVMGLVDTLEWLPKDDPNRNALIHYLQDAMESLMHYRDPSCGVWYQVLDEGGRKGNYLESSASCMICCAAAKGARTGVLPKSYAYLAKKIFADILTEFVTVRKDGLLNLNKVCAVAGLGGKDRRDGTFAYYISEPIVANDFKGVGPFIHAGSEIEL